MIIMINILKQQSNDYKNLQTFKNFYAIRFKTKLWLAEYISEAEKEKGL